MRWRGVAFSVLLALLCGCASLGERPAPASDTRAAWLEMFARGYFPGRSGQIFVVPREGEFVTRRHPHARFMHGSPWSYDVRIPLLLHGAALVRAGVYREPAAQEDVAPTIAALLGLPPTATMTGRVLEEAITSASARPAVVLLLAVDGMRADYLDRHGDVMPTMSRLRREGAWFPEARVSVLPTVTSVGHANIGTGTIPAVHGLAANTLYDRLAGKMRSAYGEEPHPRDLMALTLADVWSQETDGRAIVVAQGGADSATLGLVGHGACGVNGWKVIAVSYSDEGRWETHPECFLRPEYLDARSPRALWESVNGSWMGHDVSNPDDFAYSGLFQRFEGETLLELIEHEPLGEDPVADLILVNWKATDYVGHAYGPDSQEIKETLAELDRQLGRVFEALKAKARGRPVVVAVTADHGMPGEPPPGGRRYRDDVEALLHARFDPGKKLVALYDPPSNQMFLDRGRLAALGLSLREVASFLQSEGPYAAVFTEDEVRTAAAARRGRDSGCAAP